MITVQPTPGQTLRWFQRWSVLDGETPISTNHADERSARIAAGEYAASVADERTGPTLSAHLRASANQSAQFLRSHS